MKQDYLLKLATVKQADLKKEIEKAKKLRDSSIWLDLLKNSVKGGLGGGAAALMGSIGIGAPAGFRMNTEPIRLESSISGEPIYKPHYNIDGYIVRNTGKGTSTIEGTLASGTKFTGSVPENEADLYRLYGEAGAADIAGKLLKKTLKPGIGIGAGLGALYSLLTYGSRKAKAEKQLKELGIE